MKDVSTAGIDEVLRTTRAFRRRLDVHRPLAPTLIDECLDIAIRAPSGANRQRWRFLVIENAERKAAVAQHYRTAFYGRYGDGTGHPAAEYRSAAHLADRLATVPALVLVCAQGRLAPDVTVAQSSSFYGSVYPAVWNFALALRARGAGTVVTTVHLQYERQVADLLGIPYDDVTQIALLPVAYLTPGPVSEPARTPAEDVTYRDRWGRN